MIGSASNSPRLYGHNKLRGTEIPVFTAIAAAISTFVTGLTWASVAAFAVRTVVMIGISKLLSNRAEQGGAGQDAGARVQLPPATNNKIPIVYGTAYIAPVITDAKISTDQKTMWYVCSLAEKTDTGTISFGDMYMGGKKLNFDPTDQTKVVSWETVSLPPQVDDKVNGKMYVWKYSNGSSSGTNTSQTAIQVLQDAAIPVAQHWAATDTMTNVAFVIIKMVYNQDAGMTGLGQIAVKLTNSLTEPGSVIKDYMENTVYGCAIPASQVDQDSLTALNAYSASLINYTPIGGGTATQARYLVNGPLNTGNDCLTNLQQLVDTCDSWLQYSELTAKWKVVINQPYAGTLLDLYHINDDVLMGGIDVSPIDLNSSYNSLEVQYPNINIKDQTDYKIVELDASLLSPNEPPNRLTIQFPQVNNAVQALYLGNRRLFQNREDLMFTTTLDYSGIQIEAGDVVRITFSVYGWTNKLFRVSQVQEAKLEDGALGVKISGFEYNATVYVDNIIQDYVPSPNTDLINPAFLGTPIAPTVTTSPNSEGTVKSFWVQATVPAGLVLSMDYSYGKTNDITQHILYKSTTNGAGIPFPTGATPYINITDFDPGTWYWSITARNTIAGKQGPASTGYVWAGPNVTVYDPGTGTGGIGIGNINPNLMDVTRGIGGVNFSVANPLGRVDGDPPKLPVSVLSTTTRNIPIYIPGTNVSSTRYYPYAQGTATLGMFYGAASTAPYTPRASRLLLINDGDNDGLGGVWYKLIYDTFPAGSVTAAYTLFNNYGATIVSDVDCTVQLVAGILINGEAYYQTDTEKFTTIALTATKPHIWAFTETWQHTEAPNIIGAGLFCRNMTAGSNMSLVSASLRSSVAPNPYT